MFLDKCFQEGDDLKKICLVDNYFMIVIKWYYELVMYVYGVFKLKKIDVVFYSFRDW